MEEYRVALMGHRVFYPTMEVEERLHALLYEFLSQKDYVELLIGRNGSFDLFAASAVKRAQAALGKERLSMTLVLPYPQKDMEYYEVYYDSILIPQEGKRVHPKNAIPKRNRWMVEYCDAFVCYAQGTKGGVETALRYAKRLQKKVWNLAMPIG